ncbi:MAG: hypothetical protein IT230_04985 [Flavobacteriales bacterium]|nr:hypothetical protein [Flavobacteriales bacterium]
MKTPIRLRRSKQLIPLFVVAAIAGGCDGKAGSGSSVGTMEDASRRVLAEKAAQASLWEQGAKPVQTGSTAGASAHGADATGAVPAGDRYDALGKLDPNGSYDINGAVLPGTVLTGNQERTDAMARMNGIRAILTTELEGVRATLKDGTVAKEVAAANKQRAAELAQGLERVDRTLAAMGGASDATWTEMRDTQLKEVNEVRAWWSKYMSGRTAEAAK